MDERWTQTRTFGIAVPGLGERFQGALDLFRAQPCASRQDWWVMRYSNRADRADGAWN